MEGGEGYPRLPKVTKKGKVPKDNGYKTQVQPQVPVLHRSEMILACVHTVHTHIIFWTKN